MDFKDRLVVAISAGTAPTEGESSKGKELSWADFQLISKIYWTKCNVLNSFPQSFGCFELLYAGMLFFLQNVYTWPIAVRNLLFLLRCSRSYFVMCPRETGTCCAVVDNMASPRHLCLYNVCDVFLSADRVLSCCNTSKSARLVFLNKGFASSCVTHLYDTVLMQEIGSRVSHPFVFLFGRN